MPRYIDFATNPKEPNALGNPTYDGKAPTRFRSVLGVRINGEKADFADESLTERLHKAILDGKALKDDGIHFDCVAFALLMGGVDLVSVCEGRDFKVASAAKEVEEISDDDTSQLLPVAIGAWPWREDHPIYYHTVVPAHMTERASYVHKLGDEGPLCISSLAQAVSIMHGSHTALVTSMTVSVEDVQVAEWKG